ncbi:MAG: M28 family peptidase [Muribaculaceae bacterium]|nr:M28 family peptidase [Muribaculaceae bacterium]
MSRIAVCISFAAALCGCGGAQASRASQPVDEFVEQGTFSGDSAYAYVARQVEFGPRVPGSAAHAACVDWLTATLKRLGADTVSVSDGTAVRWDGETVPVRNIFARVNPGAPVRLLLVSHYDSRPWADQDPDPDRRNEPISGADDGASGVGVILEVVRNLAANPAAVGVDVLFTDAEDSGAPQGVTNPSGNDGWCLGAKYFAENLPYATAADLPRYGILLDMVGAPGARFMQEYFSANEARRATARVWGTAARMGLADKFPAVTSGAITDDHLPLIAAGIPTTDIIHTSSATSTGFNPAWHTHADDMGNIDPTTLSTVGRVVLNTIYTEQP